MDFVGGLIQNGLNNMVDGAVSGAMRAGGEYAGDLVVGAGNYIESGGRYVGDSVTGYFQGYGDGIKKWGGGNPSVGYDLSNMKAGSGPKAPSLKRSLSVPAGTKSTGTLAKSSSITAPKSQPKSYAAAASKGTTGTGAKKALPAPQPLKGPNGKPITKAPQPLKGPDGKPLMKQTAPQPLKGAGGKALKKPTAPAPLKGPGGQPLKKTPSAAAKTTSKPMVGTKKYSDAQTKTLYGGQGAANKKVTTTPNVGQVTGAKTMAKK